MVKGAAQARKKKVVAKNEPVEEVAPPAEEVAEEETPAEEAPMEEQEESAEMEVSLEAAEGEEEVTEPGDEILEDDNNNDAEELAEDVVNEEDIEEEYAEEGDEEGGEEAKEGEETEETGENGEAKKRKADGSQPAAKKLKVEPKPVRVKLYTKRAASDLFDTSLETFLKDNEIEIKEFKPNTDTTWRLSGQVILTKAEDRQKILDLTGKEVAAREIKFEVIEEPNKGDDSLKKLQAPDEVILFVRNLHKTVTEEELKKIFPSCVELHLPQKSGRIKGFAFLQFSTKEEVAEQIKTKQNAELSGRKLVLSRFASRSSGEGNPNRAHLKQNKNKDQAGNSQNRVLFVGNLSFDTKEEKVMRIFRTAENVKILRFANTGKSKGVAFIEFRTPMAARKAFEKFSNAKIDGRSINLEYADQDKFKNERGNMGRAMMGAGGGRRLSGGGRPMQGFNAGGGRPFRDAGQIRSLLDTMQLERSMEFENRWGNMGGGMSNRMNMGLDSGMGMGGRMGLDSNLGMDSGYGSRMSLGSNMGGRMGLESGLSSRMSLDSGIGRRMGMDSGFGMGDRMGLESSYGNRMSMDTGMGSFAGGRMEGNFGGNFKSRGMNNRMRQGNRKSWN